MNILYIKHSNNTFVLKDEKILKSNFNTYSFLLLNKTRIIYLISIIKMIIFLIKYLPKANIVFTRFADYHTFFMTFLSKLYNKKVIIVSGGYDVMYIKEINYGAYNNSIRSFCTRYTLKNADYILPVSQSLIYEKNNFAFNREIESGIKYFVPNTKAKIQVIHNGYNPGKWITHNTINKENIALLVANINTTKVFIRKGVDKFIETAIRLPKYTFIIIGMSESIKNKYLSLFPTNLKIIGKLKHEELIDHYAKSKVYCMFSIAEGMPNVLSEAMLCKCIPVGTNNSSIPEIIGDTGFIIKNNKIEEYVQAVEMAFQTDSIHGLKAREHIKKNYLLEKRERELIEVINKLS